MQSTRAMMGINLRFVAGAALVASTAVGCTAAPAYEPQQSSEQKLLAPKALFKAKASAVTKKETGISEWRVFRGKEDFVLTGYDGDGEPVGGTAFRFAKDGSKNLLKARILDGNAFKTTYAFGASTSSTSSAKTSTQKLFRRAAADMLGIRLTLQEMGRGYKGSALANQNLGLPQGIPAGVDPFGGVADPFGQLGQMGCGGDLVSMLMGAMQCVGGAGGLAGAQSNPMQLLQCALASQGAASSMGTCQAGGANPLGQLGQLGQLGNLGGANGLPFDPMSIDPNSQFGTQDPFGQLGQLGQLGQPGQQPGLPGQTGQVGGMDPFGIDPMGQGQFDPLGQGDPFGQGACQSCGGQFDDFGVDPMNGGVGFDQGMGQGMDPGMGGGMQDI
jgi:hypothetical protein